MPFFHYDNIKITGVSSAVPRQKVSLESFVEDFGRETVDKFSKMTGVKEFRKTLLHQTASDLGYVAAEQLLSHKNISREDIGALVFVAHSVDYRRPATACVLHKRLGLSKECAVFDIGLGCSATVYGLQVLSSMMTSSDISKALLVTGETLTKMVNPKDRSVAMLFGDGGSAILLEKEDSLMDILLRSDGNGYKSIIAPAGGYRNLNAPCEDELWSDGNIRNLYNTYMSGTDVFSFTITEVPIAINNFISRTGVGIEKYDCFAFHQANQYISKQLAKKFKIPAEKMPLCLDRYGNTSAPAATMALCDRYGDIKGEHIKIMFCCFGVGLSWGVASAVIEADDILQIIETDEVFEEGIIKEPL
ncbi:ketoacyl-ACP synthase III [bacterium 210820-DFI.6.37]|nr:ketoacyl-ACP synthase III [bacterium 210820-DFI.6.37]